MLTIYFFVFPVFSEQLRQIPERVFYQVSKQPEAGLKENLAVPLFFQPTSRCLDTLIKHSSSCLMDMERYSIECRKTKTKVITLTNHNSRKKSNEPIRARSKYMSPVPSAGKRVRVSHDWFWFYF